ncbi:hypothetical protein HS088_TW04G00413 [Tripterygium wilfordii]|uniref:Uncharacterized protein n=1 Tax=Tripterygium wilfordii TaxID=458696 RepID=A0A7J7DQA5_TRIWF|nr:uncharacterized protein LOC119997202 [Tripterygium wilfordii]KAF5748459.1 hypothetical protein HS088_TW04G00413 [Tripterygium wilfordii]
MATSSKFDLSSGSPDRQLYANGQRGSNLAVSTDRSVSFRESMENPILSSLPNMSRSSSCVTQGDAVNFFQCLPFDPKVVAADHKSNHQGDLKRHINVALGSVDDSPSVSLKGKMLPSPMPEEIKRIRDGLCENLFKARERVKIFNEALSVFNKFFPSVPSKKRSRLDGFSNDRPNAMLSSDQSVLVSNLGKIGLQNHSISGFEHDQQKSEERVKSAVPKKRTRTSLVDMRMDARGSTIVRTSVVVDREREMVRLANSGAVQGDDRSLSIGVDGWEKSKMRKKRSGIKPDLSPTLVLAKSTDGYREPKQGMQQRFVSDVRSKSNNDSYGFRPGAANGAMGIGKSDGVSQQTGLVMRSSVLRTDAADNGSLLSERRDRLDKERVNLRAVNRTIIRDSPSSDSTMSSTKMNASVRGPRSGSGIAPKLSPVVQRATASNDWELSHCTNKSAAVIGVNNRKRTTSARSSSPPVAHWAGQRPQKISRTARRTNLVPIVSNNDETSALDAVSDATGHEVGLGFARRLTGSSPQQVKIKGEPMSSAALSESEESGAPEIKSKERCKKSDDIVEKGGRNVQKMSTLILPTRKNKLLTGEDLGENIRRQGRSGRGFTSARSLVPASAEKLGNVGTAKQLRSTRLGFVKSDSKTGRPPTRKLSDRKAYKHHKHMAVSTAADFFVGSDDGHEELLAAANAVINPAYALSSSFWRQMEPLFGLMSDIDIASLEQRGSFEGTAATVATDPNPSGVNGINIVPNGNGLIDSDGEVGLAGETRDITLCQRLISAIISEEDYHSGNDELECEEYGSENDLDGECQENGLNQLGNIQFAGNTPFKGYRMPGERECGQPKVNMLGTPRTGINSNFGHPPNGQLSDQAPMPRIAYPELQYDTMDMNEKLYLELQSIGICPEIMPDRGQKRTEGISMDISKLEEEYHGQISTKKVLLISLLKSASENKELQEKEFEQHAHDKLVTMAYQKYMTCWGPNATGGKSSSSKMAKQSALAFVKRTLERCHNFEDTGKSCFSEPLFKDILLSRPSQLNCSQSVHTPTDGESAKPFSDTSSRSLEGRVSASMISQPANLVSQLSQNGDSYINSSGMLPTGNQLAEQTSVKEDVWSNRVKKREILLDDFIGGTLCTSSSAHSGIGTSLSSSTKGKRSERDREGKDQGREVLSMNGNNKIGRPALSNAKGERKSKTKPKQKTTQLSVAVNGLLGKISEQPKPTLLSESKSSEMTSNAKEKNGFGLDSLDEAIDLSSLQLPGMDVLGVPDDFGGQGQDLGSWLNIDDDGLQDHDFMGLEIPMDDLSDLKMMV